MKTKEILNKIINDLEKIEVNIQKEILKNKENNQNEKEKLNFYKDGISYAQAIIRSYVMYDYNVFDE